MLQDLRFAFRTFAKNPGFTALAVLVLAIGIGANSAMFTVVNALLFKPLAGDADALVGVYSLDREERRYRSFSYPNYIDIREHGRDVFEHVMAQAFAMVGLGSGEATRRAFAALVSSNYFAAMNVPLAIGRTFTPDEERPGAGSAVAIVSYEYWRQAGFDPGVLGRVVRVNGADVPMVGVAPRGFTGTMALVAPDIWLPLGMWDAVVNDVFKHRGTGLADRANHVLNVAVRLKPGSSEAAAAERLAAIGADLERLYPAENRNQQLSIHPLSRLATSTEPLDDSVPAIGSALLMALSGVVLVVACLNIANMLLARGAARRKEIAIRVAVGGGRRRIVRQLVTEGFLLACAGAAGGLLLAFWINSVLFGTFAEVLPVALVFQPQPDRNVLLVTIGITMLATILFGVGPALRSTNVDVVDDLKGIGARAAAPVAGRRFGARNMLVVSQIALSLVLLCTGGLFARGALAATAADPGFAYDRLLLVSIDPAMAGDDPARTRTLQREAIDRLRRLPGVESVAFASTVPFGDFHEGMPVEAVGAPSTSMATRSPTYRIVGADYFRTLGLSMLRGREFTREEEESAAAPRVAILDEALARRLFPNQDPIGQFVRVVIKDREVGSGNDGEPMEVVGVAPPIRDLLFERTAQPHLYVPLGRNHRSMMYMHVRIRDRGAAAAANVLPAIRRELASLDARLPVLDSMTMRQFHNRSAQLWAIRAGGGLVIGLGLAALLLAVAGVYGVNSYVVSQRTREFGVRVALGARPSDVMWMVLREGLTLTTAGVIVGLGLAALAGVALSRLLYEVSPLDPVVFMLAPATLATAALAASWIPARRATRVAPVVALRNE